ncbi:MAG: iron-containing alcohol dehydrogenase [bacterium]
MIDQETSRFDFFQPTKLYFGTGRIATAGETAASIGKNALLVHGPGANKYIPEGLAGIRGALKRAGVGFEEFDKVQPNPVIGDVQEGAAQAKDIKADVVIGMGGGTVSLDPSPDIIHEQITIHGSWVTSLGNMEDLVERLVRWNLHPETLTTHRFPLEKADEAYATMDAGHCGKVAVVWD